MIDVRTPEEYQAGHLIGSVNIPYQEIGERITEITTDKKQAIQCYCRSGRRSGIATKTLQSLGYTNAQNAGGFEALKAQGKKSSDSR